MARTVTLTPDEQAGKAAFKALAKAFGGQEAVEAEFGVRQQKVSDMGLPNVAEFPTLNLIDALEERTVGYPGWPHVTAWLARRRGCVLVCVPSGDASAEDINGAIAVLSREHGDALATLLTAMADKQLTPREREDVDKELTDTIEAAVRLRALIRAE